MELPDTSVWARQNHPLIKVAGGARRCQPAIAQSAIKSRRSTFACITLTALPARGAAEKPDPDLGGLCGPSAASPSALLAHVCRIRLLRCSAAPCARPTYATDL